MRLRLALDRVELQRGGEPVQFPEVQAFLADRGVGISRARWAYMLNGNGSRTKDRDLLAGLSELLDVPESFFYTGEIPEGIKADIELVTAMRAVQVQNFAARQLGDLAPEALEAIADVLRDIEQERGAATSQE